MKNGSMNLDVGYEQMGDEFVYDKSAKSRAWNAKIEW